MAEICVTLARRRHGKLIEEMGAAVEAGARMLEIRFDYLGREPRFHDILERRQCPLVATFRRREDGGQWRGDEAKRLQYLRMAIAAGFDYVDIEWDVADRVARYGKTRRIISHHDMQAMPERLGELHATMKKLDPDVIKIAAKANHPADNFSMFRMIQDSSTPTIGLCMGDLGTASRVLGAKYGAPFTYAVYNPMRLVAPGILTFADFRDLYPFEGINSATDVYGVIGDPVAQSLSPLVHNTCYRELGLNKVYVPFRVPVECLDRFLTEGKSFLSGLSVTIPHKQAILSHGTAVDPLVKETGSANTMVARPSGEGYDLYNTDGPAAILALESALEGHNHGTLKDRAVTILGAGGVARTIAHGLRDKGAIVSITNRTQERAHDLARDAGCNFLEWAQRHNRHADILINCTKLGMYPHLEASPFHAGSFQEGMIVFDTVYNPETTMLLREARDHGATTVSGVEMFVRQAEAQFRLFTGVEPPPGLMAVLVREELSPARNMLREARRAGEAPT